jgi:putative transposase
VKFGFVAKHRGIWPVEVLCEALGVSRSGFYAWRQRPSSVRARTDAAILQTIRASFALSDSTYGVRRVNRHLILPTQRHLKVLTW